MESFFSQIEWVTVAVSFLIAFALGWLWYSDRMFGKGWRAGMGAPVYQAPMWMPMAAQAGATLLFALIINLATADGDIGHAVLVTLAIAGFVKANGFFSGKTKWAVSVETLYIIVMGAIMIAVNHWF